MVHRYQTLGLQSYATEGFISVYHLLSHSDLLRMFLVINLLSRYFIGCPLALRKIYPIQILCSYAYLVLYCLANFNYPGITSDCSLDERLIIGAINVS